MSLRERLHNLRVRLQTVFAPQTPYLGSAGFGGGAVGTENYFNFYRKISIIRTAINTTAYYATQKGFNVVVEPVDSAKSPEDFAYVKKYAEQTNRRCNLEGNLFIAEVNRQIYGRSAFEIVRDSNGNFARLIPLDPSAIEPHIDEKWNLLGFNYQGQEDFYKPEDVLYFVNNPVDPDMLGLSAIEPIVELVNIKRSLEYDIKEAALRLWAPIGLYRVDTSGIPPEQEDAFLEAIKQKIKPGTTIVTNKAVEGAPIDLRPDLHSLVEAKERIDEEIIGNWQMPKTLFGREKTVTRASLETALKALFEGPIAGIQAYYKQELERQWYDRMLVALGVEDQVRLRHEWLPVSYYDFIQMSPAVAKLFSSGAIDRAQVQEILRMDRLHFGERKALRKPVPVQKTLEDYERVRTSR